jgi:hypothetical protein
MGIQAVIPESGTPGTHPLGAPIVANHKNASFASYPYNRPGCCWRIGARAASLQIVPANRPSTEISSRLMMRQCLWRHPMAATAPHVMAVGLLVPDKSVEAQIGVQHCAGKGYWPACGRHSSMSSH